MNKDIERYQAEIKELDKRIQDLHTAIFAIQKVCDHDMKLDWASAHRRFYSCKECGWKETL